jgi:hypothetical protein
MKVLTLTSEVLRALGTSFVSHSGHGYVILSGWVQDLSRCTDSSALQNA